MSMTHKCHECGDYYYGDDCPHCRIQCKNCKAILHGKVNNKLVDFERWRSPSGDYYCNDSLCYGQELIKEVIVPEKCPHPDQFNPICTECEYCKDGALILLTQDDYYYCWECWNSGGRLNTLKRLGWAYYG